MESIIIFIYKVYIIIRKIIGMPINRYNNQILKLIKMPDNIVIITGSNGKSMVAEMTEKILKKSRFLVKSNRNNGNDLRSIQHFLLRITNIFGKIKTDILIIECSLECIKSLLDLIKPKYLVVTNLNQENSIQLGSPEEIYDTINSMITYDINLILNADDSLCYALGYKKEKVIYYGNKTNSYLLSQINSTFINNCLCAFSISKMFGIDDNKIISTLTNYKIRYPIVEHFKSNHVPISVLPVKHGNPISYNQALKWINQQKKKCSVIIIINNVEENITIDSSWIWNVDFSLLKDEIINKVIIAGNLANDLVVRLEYANISKEKIMMVNENELVKEIQGVSGQIFEIKSLKQKKGES